MIPESPEPSLDLESSDCYLFLPKAFGSGKFTSKEGYTNLKSQYFVNRGFYDSWVMEIT